MMQYHVTENFCVCVGGGGGYLNISLLFAPFARLREFECTLIVL